MHPMFIAALFTIPKKWKQPKCPSVDEWIKQLWDICTMEYYLVMKKENFTPCRNMVDLESLMLSERSQRDTNTM